MKAGAIYFAIVFAAAFAIGVVRTLWIAPSIGNVSAVLLELPIVLTISWFTSLHVTQWYHVAREPAPRAVMGIVAFLLLMVAEMALSVLLFGRSLADYLVSFTSASAQIGLAGQIGFALIPLLQLQLLRRHTP